MGINVIRKGITDRFMDEIASIAAEKPDFVYNLVESINNKGELNYFIPALLNMYSIPYSGNPLEAMFITSNKNIASKTMKDAGISNPAIILHLRIKLLKPGRRYIVKPIWEDGSLVLLQNLCLNVNRVLRKNLTGWMIRIGLLKISSMDREFNMSVLAGKEGPEVLPPAEIVFSGL